MPSRPSRLVAAAALSAILAAGAAAQENQVDSFYNAIRANDLSKLAVLLSGGADVNFKDDRGITPLMYAAWVGSVDAMKLLLDRGADPNLANSNGSTALMMSVTELPKVKLLTERKADVNKATSRGRTALLLAAMSDRSADIVKTLIAAGADVTAVDAMGYTALLAAAQGNDAETLRVLLDAGLDVNATNFAGFTPLIYAGSNGNLAAAKLLLARGADVKVVSNDGSFQKVKAGTIALGNFTALNAAAPFGSFELVKTLIDAGADVNEPDVRGMTPLMLAVATDRQNLDTIRALIASGADLNAKSTVGETALDWARKTGGRAVIDMLTRAGANATTSVQPVLPPFAPADLRTAAQRSVTQMERTTIGAAAGGGCASCHSHNITDLVTHLARAKGLSVDDKAAADRRQLTRAAFFSPLNLLERLDGPGAPDVPLFALGGLAAAGQAPDRVTDGIMAVVQGLQAADGHWSAPQGAVARPPIEDGDIVRTALGIAALKTYGSPARVDVPARLARARAWLAQATPFTNYDRNLQLLGLDCAGADHAQLEGLAKPVLASQRPDGGWAQRAEFESDAYATGQTLYVLGSLGLLSPRAAAYQKGVKLLLATQHADGSWYVRSRAPKFQPYYESGFPYHHDQWISSMATGWATAALTLALDDPRGVAANRANGR